MQSQDYSQQTFWLKIREFFWPILEPIEVDSEALPPDDKIVIDEDNLDQAFELINKYAEGEEERRKGIESKATLFLSTISIATSLIVASSALLLGNTDKSWPVVATMFLSFILTLYACTTVWFSIKALERGHYVVVGFNDLNFAGDKIAYKKHLILTIKKKTTFNYKTINEKVDNLTMAQQYYKRAIVVICIYAFLLTLFCIFIMPVGKQADRDKQPPTITIKPN